MWLMWNMKCYKSCFYIIIALSDNECHHVIKIGVYKTSVSSLLTCLPALFFLSSVPKTNFSINLRNFLYEQFKTKNSIQFQTNDVLCSWCFDNNSYTKNDMCIRSWLHGIWNYFPFNPDLKKDIQADSKVRMKWWWSLIQVASQPTKFLWKQWPLWLEGF